MPTTYLLAETWRPHRWVIDAMLMAAAEAEGDRDWYRSGNTVLLEALMRLVEGQGEGAAAFARDALDHAGMLNGADGTLNWQALEARRTPKQIPWALLAAAAGVYVGMLIAALAVISR